MVDVVEEVIGQSSEVQQTADVWIFQKKNVPCKDNEGDSIVIIIQI